MKYKSKRIAVIFLSILVAFGITLGAGIALASGDPEETDEHGASELDMTCWSSPRFPVAGEEAEVTCEVSHDESPAEGLAVTLQLVRMELGHHGEGSDDHDEAVADDDHDEVVADDHHDEAVADDDHDEAEVESVEGHAFETAPGIYVAKYTFEQEGKYLGTAQIGKEHTEFVVAVRSKPVAWPFLTGLAVVPLLLVGVVAVIKTVRRKW